MSKRNKKKEDEAKSNKKKEDEIKGSATEPLVDDDENVEKENNDEEPEAKKPKAASKKKSEKKEAVKESSIKISLATALRYAPYERGLKERLASKYGAQEHTEDEWAKIIAEEITQR